MALPILRLLADAPNDHQDRAIPLTLLSGPDALAVWLGVPDNGAWRDWVQQAGFTAAEATWCLLPNHTGGVAGVLATPSNDDPPWAISYLVNALPAGLYELKNAEPAGGADQAALGWALGSYRFDRYKSKAAAASGPRFLWPEGTDHTAVCRSAEAMALIRDLINTPADHMGPPHLAEAVETVAARHGATCSMIVGDDLLNHNYPAIHAVGRASAHPPRLIDMTWGDAAAPKVTLVGKGVCFDTGGLDLKSSANMRLMKKDMGGAAHALGLAQMIMDANLPVRLRLLIPAVENSVSGNALHPLDVIPSRKGLSIEIGNTDAEGRVILADALAEADSENPQLLIDMATLTGAARVALGFDLPALFCNDDDLAHALEDAARQTHDPVWRMPLWSPYRKMMDSPVADIRNESTSAYGGAITAALFLADFVSPQTPWMHLDMMAWNIAARPGRPEGGEALAVRALFALIRQRFDETRFGETG